MAGHRNQSYSYIYKGIILIAVILVTAFTFVFWTMPPEAIMRIGSYIQVLTLTIFVITGTLAVLSFKQQNEDRQRMSDLQYSNISQGKIGDIDRLFMTNPLLDRLYFEMYQHDPHIQRIIRLRGPIKPTPDMLKHEHMACNLIFQKMADIYMCEHLDKITSQNVDGIEWLNTFRAWMKSPLLRAHWATLKYEEHPTFREFVDTYLIEKNKFIHRPSSRPLSRPSARPSSRSS